MDHLLFSRVKLSDVGGEEHGEVDFLDGLFGWNFWMLVLVVVAAFRALDLVTFSNVKVQINCSPTRAHRIL